MPTINISDDSLLEIMSEVGFPILEFDDDFPYTRDQVKSLGIWPAMKEYYRFWPKKNIQEYTVSGNFSIDFPNNETFYLTDARVNSNVPIGSHTPDPIVNAMNIVSIGSQSSGMYGTRYNYDITTAYHMKRAEYNALKNSQKAFRVDVDRDNKLVTGYTSVQGRMLVEWAEYGLDYDKIPFSKIDDAKRLAQSYIMRMLGNFLSLQSSDTVNELDGGFLLDRADDLREDVIDRWQKITKPVIMRM